MPESLFRVMQYWENIKEDVEQLIDCHCTSYYAMVRLRNALGDKVSKGGLQ